VVLVTNNNLLINALDLEIIKDPDPGGPKRNWSYGSGFGSGTLEKV
jgi:hypothetical protein